MYHLNGNGMNRFTFRFEFSGLASKLNCWVHNNHFKCILKLQNANNSTNVLLLYFMLTSAVVMAWPRLHATPAHTFNYTTMSMLLYVLVKPLKAQCIKNGLCPAGPLFLA